MSHHAANIDWRIKNDNGTVNLDLVPIAVLMDIRRELQTLNRLLHCQNFLNIPSKLDRIRINTTKRRRRRKI